MGVPTHIAAYLERLSRKFYLRSYSRFDRCRVQHATGCDTVQRRVAARVSRSRSRLALFSIGGHAADDVEAAAVSPERLCSRRQPDDINRRIACVASEVCCTFSVLKGDTGGGEGFCISEGSKCWNWPKRVLRWSWTNQINKFIWAQCGTRSVLYCLWLSWKNMQNLHPFCCVTLLMWLLKAVLDTDV